MIFKIVIGKAGVFSHSWAYKVTKTMELILERLAIQLQTFRKDS